MPRDARRASSSDVSGAGLSPGSSPPLVTLGPLRSTALFDGARRHDVCQASRSPLVQDRRRIRGQGKEPGFFCVPTRKVPARQEVLRSRPPRCFLATASRMSEAFAVAVAGCTIGTCRGAVGRPTSRCLGCCCSPPVPAVEGGLVRHRRHHQRLQVRPAGRHCRVYISLRRASSAQPSGWCSTRTRS
jgi:hypothetical protein